MRHSVKRTLSAVGAAGLVLVTLGLVALSTLFGPNVPDGPLADQIDWLVDHAVKKQGMAGNVLVVRRGEQYYERSTGYADLASEMPNTRDTRFPIASLSKPITAILIMQMVEAGDLGTDSTLDSIFANLHGKPAGATTIHQLLTHTSGIKEIIDRDIQRRITPEDLETATIDAPGEFKYNNSGYVILALVVEKLTGMSYEAAMQRHVFEPAGMQDTGLMRSGVKIDEMATGYRLENGEYVEAPLHFAIEAVDGAGSIYSTLHDLWSLARSLDNNTLISSQTRTLMEAQHIDGRFGYGWFLDEQGGKYYPWHSGEFDGFATAMAIQTHRDEVVVILSNLEGANARQLCKRILRVLKEQAGN